MPSQPRPFWTSEFVAGPAGRFRVIVTRLTAGPGKTKDQYAATLYRKGDEGDEPIEQGFWENNAPPHDADKLAFRQRAKHAAESVASAKAADPA